MIAVVVDMRELFVAERAEVASFSLILQKYLYNKLFFTNHLNCNFL